MCGGGSDAPSPPDPYATAAAQANANKETALYQAQLNRYNQITPYGNLTWSAPASGNETDPWTQTVTLDGAQRQLLDAHNQASLGLGTAINNVLGHVNANSVSPVNAPDLSGYGFNRDTMNNVAGELYGQYSSLYKPQQQQALQQLQDQLQAQGLAPGSQAYKTAVDNISRQQSAQDQQAMSSAYTNATNQAIQQAAAGRTNAQAGFQDQLAVQNQLLNALASLRSGSQVQNPSFSGESTGVGVGQTPLSSSIYSSYNGALQSSMGGGGGMAGWGSMLGGLGGLMNGGANLGSSMGWF